MQHGLSAGFVGWLSSGHGQRVVPGMLVALLILVVLGSSLRTNYYFHGQLPYSIGFVWPQQTPHSDLAQRFIDMIPSDASVSAQSKLPPHMSHREHIYLFPYADTTADYVLLDVNGDIYPFFHSTPYADEPAQGHFEAGYQGYGDYISEVKRVLASGQYGVAAAQDGYLLLKRGLAPPRILAGGSTQQNDPLNLTFDLPTSFCSNVYVGQKDVKNPVSVEFTRSDVGTLNLVGYEIGASSPFSRTNGYGTLTTYWRVAAPIKKPVQLQIHLQGADGKDYLVSNDIPTMSWCPPQSWRQGSIVEITSSTFNLHSSAIPNGLAQMSITLLPQPQTSSTIGDIQNRLPLRIVKALEKTITASKLTNELQLMPLTVVN
jgi:hypothetical protein